MIFFRHHRRLEENPLSSRFSCPLLCSSRAWKGAAKCSVAPRKGALVSRSTAQHFVFILSHSNWAKLLPSPIFNFLKSWVGGLIIKLYLFGGGQRGSTNLLIKCVHFSILLQNRAWKELPILIDFKLTHSKTEETRFFAFSLEMLIGLVFFCDGAKRHAMLAASASVLSSWTLDLMVFLASLALLWSFVIIYQVRSNEKSENWANGSAWGRCGKFVCFETLGLPSRRYQLSFEHKRGDVWAFIVWVWQGN